MTLVVMMIAVLAANVFYLLVKIWEDIACRRWVMAATGLLSVLGMNGIIAFILYSALANSTDL